MIKYSDNYYQEQGICKKCGRETDSSIMGYCKECYERNKNRNTLSKEEKQRLQKLEHYGLSEEESEIKNMKYEYMVKSFADEGNGDTDPNMLERLINNYARQGWRLKQIYTNELGKNSLGLGFGGLGSQTNATMERTFIIFEREVIK